MCRQFGLTLLMWLMAATPSYPQEPTTRSEADRRQRAEKNESLRPYTPGGFERAMRFVEEKAIFIVAREGFYPKIGSLTTGSGFAFGPGYRDRDLFKNKGTFDVWVATSRQLYWATEARLALPKLANKRLMVETWAGHRDYPQEDFFGVGPDSARDQQTSYAIRSDFVGAKAGVRPHQILTAGAGVEYLNPRLGQGKDPLVPSIEHRFSSSTAPGLAESVDYVRSIAFLEVDYREPKNARNGGWYRIDFSRYDDRGTGLYSFRRLDTDLRQFVGFLAGRRVLAARLFVSTSDTDAFWAARIVARFTDEMVAAVVAKAQYSDPRATEYLTRTLIARRDKVVATWLNQVCPVVTPRLRADGVFTFANAAVEVRAAAPADSYELQWFRFDNATGTRTSAGDARVVSELISRAPAELHGPGEFVGVAVTARHSQHRGWARPATFFFRRTGQEWSLVGVERG